MTTDALLVDISGDNDIRYCVLVDDDDEGTVTMYVHFLPEYHQDDGESDRAAYFNYDKRIPGSRADARSHAEALATVWADEIAKRWPCEWATNY